MPQMAPLSWLILFIVFSVTLILFNTKNYFMYIPTYSKNEKSAKTHQNKTLNWKW